MARDCCEQIFRFVAVATVYVCLMVLAYVMFLLFTGLIGGHRLAEAYRMTVMFVLIMIWRWLCRQIFSFCDVYSMEYVRKATLCIDYYTPLYSCLLYEILNDMRRFLVLDLWGSSALSSSYITEQAEKAATASMTRVNQTLAADILQEVSLENFPLCLRWFPLGVPLFVLFTFYPVLRSLFEHIRVMWEVHDGWLQTHQKHGYAIMINSLPLVYGVMALKGVMRTWEVVMNTFSATVDGRFDLWSEKKELIMGLADLDFNFADLYEAWALRALVKLILINIEEYYRFSREGDDAAGHIFRTMQKLGLLGIESFLWSCGLTSAYSLAAMCLNFYGIVQISPELASSVHWFLVGVGSLASTIAIMNIAILESRFHKQLNGFRPAAKFWSTKILVSMAFLQNLALRATRRWWSTTQINLVYSALMGYECFFVALAHLWCWGADEGWYKDAGGLSAPLLAAEGEVPI